MKGLIVALGLVVVASFSFLGFGAQNSEVSVVEEKQSIKEAEKVKLVQKLLTSLENNLKNLNQEIEIYAREIIPFDGEVNAKEIKLLKRKIESFNMAKEDADANLRRYSSKIGYTIKTATVIFDKGLEKVLVGNEKEEIRRKFVELTGRYLKVKSPIVWSFFGSGIFLLLFGIGGGFIKSKPARIIWVPLTIFTGTMLFLSAFHWIETEENLYPSFPQKVSESVDSLEKPPEEVEPPEPEAKPD